MCCSGNIPRTRALLGWKDTAYLDDVYVGAPKAVTGVEIQETASVAGYRRVQLTWDVLPDVASNREVTFTSSDESVATVDENGLVTGVTQGEAVITVTTKDGGFYRHLSGFCHWGSTSCENLWFLYIACPLEGRMACQHGGSRRIGIHFDTNPGGAEEIGMMPDATSDEAVSVLCAELVDDTVYGYTMDGRFLAMDFDSLQRGRTFC